MILIYTSTCGWNCMKRACTVFSCTDLRTGISRSTWWVWYMGQTHIWWVWLRVTHGITRIRQRREHLTLCHGYGHDDCSGPVIFYVWLDRRDWTIKQGIFYMFKNRQEEALLMDALDSDSWTEMMKYVCDKEYWRSRVRALWGCRDSESIWVYTFWMVSRRHLQFRRDRD